MFFKSEFQEKMMYVYWIILPETERYWIVYINVFKSVFKEKIELFELRMADIEWSQCSGGAPRLYLYVCTLSFGPIIYPIANIKDNIYGIILPENERHWITL